MTGAALVVIALIIIYGGGDSTGDGGQVSRSKVSPTEVPAISGLVPPAKRAVAINTETGMGGFYPGDWVDVVAVNDIARTASIVLQNVKVLAETDPSSSRQDTEFRQLVPQSKVAPLPEIRATVTVAVDEQQALALAEAQEQGNGLLLTLRTLGRR